jgi:6-phosphofructokinase 1
MLKDYLELARLDLKIKNLGNCKYGSPLDLSYIDGDEIANYVMDDERIFAVNTKSIAEYLKNNGYDMPLFEKAGPREKLFFEPGKTISAIVTCGGICPGLNAVIRAVVMMNYYRYKNKSTLGIKYGYSGFIKSIVPDVIELTPDIVDDIDKHGGTILASSRGPQDVKEIVDRLVELKVNILYTVGGDGTLHGANEIQAEIEKRGLSIAVIGIPKTIDNDISYIDRTFGTETAFSKACEALDSAHTEAKASYKGIGLVKVMGRMSGFIAANTALASNNANFVLIPEVRFELRGANGFFAALKKRMTIKDHAVILVAEGAGQNLFSEKDQKYDASGNKKLDDIGVFLKDEIKKYFDEEKIPISIKYIDPSYIIRSTAPTPNDALFCLQLAQMAVHAGMSGKTGCVIGHYNGEFIHLPIKAAISKRKTIDPESELWLSVLESTGQPAMMY